MAADKNIDYELLEKISHVKTITNYKKEYCKQTSPYFIIWGLIWLIAYSTTLLHLSPYLIGIIWLVLGIIGWIITLTTYFRQNELEPMPLFLRSLLRFTWLGTIVIIGIFIFLMYTDLLLFSFNQLPLYGVLLVSIMYMMIGSVLAKEIFFMGFWLSILGMLTFSIFPEFMNVIFALIGGGSLLLTGFILKRKGQRQ